MTHTVVIDEAHRRLEIENAVNRRHRRCRIVNVKRKPVLVQELELLTRKNREAYRKALQDFRDAFRICSSEVDDMPRKWAQLRG